MTSNLILFLTLIIVEKFYAVFSIDKLIFSKETSFILCNILETQ